MVLNSHESSRAGPVRSPLPTGGHPNYARRSVRCTRKRDGQEPNEALPCLYRHAHEPSWRFGLTPRLSAMAPNPIRSRLPPCAPTRPHIFPQSPIYRSYLTPSRQHPWCGRGHRHDRCCRRYAPPPAHSSTASYVRCSQLKVNDVSRSAVPSASTFNDHGTIPRRFRSNCSRGRRERTAATAGDNNGRDPAKTLYRRLCP